MFANASQKQPKIRSRNRGLILATTFAGLVLAGSVAVSAQTGSDPAAKPTPEMRAAAADVMRNYVPVSQANQSNRNVRVINLFKVPADQQNFNQ